MAGVNFHVLACARWPLAVLLAVPLLGSTCAVPEEVQVVEVGAWGIDQDDAGDVGALAFGDLQVRFEGEEASAWPSADQAHRQAVSPPGRGRFSAEGDAEHGATRSVNLDQGSLRYRTLYLVGADALPCLHLPGGAVAGRDVPALLLDLGAELGQVSCSWDAGGLRLQAEGDGPARLDWELAVGAHDESFSTAWVDGSAKETRLWQDLTPAVGSVRLSAFDSGGAEVVAWPEQGQGRLLVLPALVDATDGEEAFTEDPFADYHAPLSGADALRSLSAHYRSGEASIELRLELDDADAQAGRPSDSPENDSSDAVAVELRVAGAAAAPVRAVAGRDDASSPGTPDGVAVSSEDGDTWSLTVTVPLDALGAGDLGKNDLLRICLRAFLDPDAAPRTPSVVWPADCDQAAARSAAVRLFARSE